VHEGDVVTVEGDVVTVEGEIMHEPKLTKPVMRTKRAHGKTGN